MHQDREGDHEVGHHQKQVGLPRGLLEVDGTRFGEILTRREPPLGSLLLRSGATICPWRCRRTRVDPEQSASSARWQVAGGWFVTPNILAKAEYVTQQYNGYPVNNIRNGGTFHGVMLEGVVAF